jgi:hypothetical protein
MGSQSISGDIIKVRDLSILFAIDGDPDDTIWIPRSVIKEGDIEEDDGVDLLIESWWYAKHRERFD